MSNCKESRFVGWHFGPNPFHFWKSISGLLLHSQHTSTTIVRKTQLSNWRRIARRLRCRATRCTVIETLPRSHLLHIKAINSVKAAWDLWAEFNSAFLRHLITRPCTGGWKTGWHASKLRLICTSAGLIRERTREMRNHPKSSHWKRQPFDLSSSRKVTWLHFALRQSPANSDFLFYYLLDL